MDMQPPVFSKRLESFPSNQAYLVGIFTCSSGGRNPTTKGRFFKTEYKETRKSFEDDDLVCYVDTFPNLPILVVKLKEGP